MNAEPDCVFCKILAGEIPNFTLWEDAHSLAFMDINPLNPGHALSISKEHAANVFEISERGLVGTVKTARRIATAVNEALRPIGINLMQANGPGAGQSVQHFHVHVIPRAENDGLLFNHALNPGDVDAIAKLAERIKAKL